MLLRNENGFKCQKIINSGNFVLRERKLRDIKDAFKCFLLSTEFVLASECGFVVEDVVVVDVFGWCFNVIP